ncbi:GNAT family N-acetyltransferase [Frederiksenia canicola]
MDVKTFWDNWIPAWAISREIPPAKKIPNGYIFDEIKDGKREQELLLYSPEHLAEAASLLSNKDYLCVSGLSEGFNVPKGWVHHLFSYMMVNENLQQQAVKLDQNFTKEMQRGENRLAIVIRNLQGEMVCCGQVAYCGEFVVFDRIETAKSYRRQGFGTLIMNLLTEDALNRGINKGLLCASEMGKGLYTTLGWSVIGQYSRMVREDYTRE